MKLIQLVVLVGLCMSASGQQIVTLTAPHVNSNGDTYADSFMVEENQSVEVLGLDFSSDSRHNNSWVEIVKDGLTFRLKHWDFSPTGSDYLVNRQYAGPCEVRLVSIYNSYPSDVIASFIVSPGQYPPGKSAVIGERDGPMKCTLEESTDLVNWTQSTSGATHSLTNVNAKKFFRIKLEQDVGP